MVFVPSGSLWLYPHADVCFAWPVQEFREKDASMIEIPNIGYDTFTAMMRYIYVGTVEVTQDQAMPLLQVRVILLCCLCL